MNTSKEEARIIVKKIISELTKDYCIKSDAKIQSRITTLSEYKASKVIFGFVGASDEINTMPLLSNILQSGKILALPKCSPKDGIMHAMEVKSLDDLEKGKFGIMEPKQHCKIISPKEIDFGIIPCLSCDSEGRRLGHGKGYYDRYLENTNFKTCIICREKVMLPEIPVEYHDKTIDIIISENMTKYIK